MRSAELVEGVLTSAGFPVEKIPAVKSVILAHTYYNANAPVTAEEIALRDADTLDFLGVIGLTRIFSVTEREKFAPDLQGGFAILENFARDLPSKLFSQHGKKLGATRGRELAAALEALNAQSYRRKAL